jgi:predicted dehydrogenase
MTPEIYRVAVVGCGRMGQQYAEVYQTLPNTELVAIAEYNPERRRVVGERFGVTALFPDAESLLKEMVPDIVAVVLPGKYIKDAVIACAQAGVRGVSTDKPIGACLADVDTMVDECRQRGVVFAGGNLQRATSQVQEAAVWLRSGELGTLQGASVHGWGGEISGGGCQHIAVLRLLADAEVTEVVAWAQPDEILHSDTDKGLIVSGQLRLSSGLTCSVFGEPTPCRGVEVWSESALVRWNWGPPEVYHGLDADGNRRRLERDYSPLDYPLFGYLGTSIQSFLSVLDKGGPLAISGHDLRQSLEVAIAAKYSALRGSVPISLPLEERSLTLYPTAYRWLGGDHAGNVQTAQEAIDNTQLG